MTLKYITRANFYSGAYAYAIVEEVNLGLATVRLVKDGARLTQLPVVGGQVLIGDTVIVDYSSNIPPVVRPIEEHPVYEDEEFEIAPMTIETDFDEEEEEPPIYFKGGDHGAQVFVSGGAVIAGNTGGAIYWNQAAYDTDGFYTPLQDSIKIPAPGFYYFVADVGWPVLGSAAGYILDPWLYWVGDTAPPNPPGWYWHPGIYPIDTPIDLRAVIWSKNYGCIGEEITHPIPRTQKKKYHTITGQAPLAADDEVGLFVTVEGIDGCTLVQEYGVCPRLTVQWLGNIRDKFTT